MGGPVPGDALGADADRADRALIGFDQSEDKSLVHLGRLYRLRDRAETRLREHLGRDDAGSAVRLAETLNRLQERIDRTQRGVAPPSR